MKKEQKCQQPVRLAMTRIASTPGLSCGRRMLVPTPILARISREKPGIRRETGRRPQHRCGDFARTLAGYPAAVASHEQGIYFYGPMPGNGQEDSAYSIVILLPERVLQVGGLRDG